MTNGADLQAHAVISIASDALAAGRDIAGGDADLGKAFDRLASAAELIGRTRAAVDRSSSALLVTANHDAKQLLTVCRSQDPDLGLVLTLTKRVTEDLESLVVAALADARPPVVAPPAPEPPAAVRDDRLVSLAADYGNDATRERRTSALLFVGSVLAFGGSVAAAGWTAHVAREARRNVWMQSLAPLIICGSAVIAGLILAWSAVSRGRAAREATRLQRGLSGLDAYLEPLPPAAQHLLRATLAQTLFPRLLEDNDPMRAPVWPDGDALLRVAGAFDQPQLSESSDSDPANSTPDPPSGGAAAP